MSSVQIEQKSYEMPPREGISIAHFLTVAGIERSARYYEKVFGASVTIHLHLFRDSQCVIDVDAAVPDGALQLAVTEQWLHDPQILGSAVDQCRLCPPHGVCAVGSWIQPDGLDPPADDP